MGIASHRVLRLGPRRPGTVVGVVTLHEILDREALEL
jgi:hypothetical protein